jgi:hypothetical protein
MKKISTLLLATIISLISNELSAQWCTPNVIPYGPTTPGITEFTLNTIDRVSPDLESPTSNYELTGLSTTLQRQHAYTISIKHTVDALICPDMNLRVWIDYNINGDLDDAGETVLSLDHHAPGTYTASFTVPATATLGETRLRVTAKMSNLGGHTLPSPCNIPPDPIGYHGEIEDFTLEITETTGIDNPDENHSIMSIFPNPASQLTTLTYSLTTNEHVRLEIFNVAGQREMMIADENQMKGDYRYELPLNGLSKGLYVARLNAGDKIYLQHLLVENE